MRTRDVIIRNIAENNLSPNVNYVVDKKGSLTPKKKSNDKSLKASEAKLEVDVVKKHEVEEVPVPNVETEVCAVSSIETAEPDVVEVVTENPTKKKNLFKKKSTPTPVDS